MKNLEPFEKVIFVTRPVFPTIEEVTEKLRDIWEVEVAVDDLEVARHLEFKVADEQRPATHDA